MKRKEDESEEVLGVFDSNCANLGPSDVERKPNRELGSIIHELETIASDQSCDAFLLYL